MREIKFRAWDEEMILSDDGTLGWFFDAYGDEDIMQFTGLQDAKGNDIYEGDVLRINTSGQDIKWASTEPVEWDDKWHGFGPICYLRYHGDSDKYCEVIGNIYETPELLK